MTRKFAFSLFLLAGFNACNPTGADSQERYVQVFDPAAPASTFQSIADAGRRQQMVESVWQTLVAPPCWDASFVGPATPSGSAASVSQFSFSGQYQYRYYGFDTYFGSIRLLDVGTYKNYPAVLMSTWTGDTEGLIMVDRNHFEHVLTNPSGAWYSVTFWTSNGPCL
jgi:hypothetical protein